MSVAQRRTVERLLTLALERGAIRYGDFTLSSGRRGSCYCDGRLLGLHPEGVRTFWVVRCCWPMLGADPVAVAMASW